MRKSKLPVWKAEHYALIAIGVFVVAFALSFAKNAGNDLGKREADRFFK